MPPVQTALGRYATDALNEEFGTNISVDRLSINLLTLNTGLKGIYVEDYKSDTLFYIQKLSTSILSLRNIANNRMEFGKVKVDGLFFNLKTYAGERDTNLDIFVDKLDDGSPKDPNTPSFCMASEAITIEDGMFLLSDENLEKVEILNFEDIAIEANDFQILGPEVTLGIEALKLKSKRGLALENLSTDFKYTKQQMRFDSLRIKTEKSFIKGDMLMNYNRADFADF
ncbi:MAG: translocation/assembly module TamB, partial [Bacteroidota bacterium]